MKELIAKILAPYFVILTFRSSSYDSSRRHVDASHWQTQPSDNKIWVSGNCFPFGGQNNKILGQARGFLCQCAKAFSVNIIGLLPPPPQKKTIFFTAFPSGSAFPDSSKEHLKSTRTGPRFHWKIQTEVNHPRPRQHASQVHADRAALVSLEL